METAPVRVVAQGLNFPEGPVWVPEREEIWCVELKGGAISCVDAAGRLRRAAHSPRPNGMKLHADGSLWICECERRAVVRLDPASGQLDVLADGCAGQPFLGPNDLCFGVALRCYFTDPHGSTREKRSGALYRREPDGRVFREFENLAYPNGLALTPDGTRLVFAETLTKRLWIADRAPDGALGGRRPFCEVGGQVGPDGMAFDAEGLLYVAIYGDGCVRVVDRGGAVLRDLPLPGRNPTNCCFGGKGFRTLYVTEAEKGELLALDLDRPGLPLPPRTPDAEPF